MVVVDVAPKKIMFILGNTNQYIPFKNIIDALPQYFDIYILVLGTYSYSPNFLGKNIKFPNAKVINTLEFQQNPLIPLFKIKPDIIVTPNDNGLPYKAFLKVAQNLKIPILYIQPAIVAHFPLRVTNWVFTILNYFSNYKYLRQLIRILKLYYTASFICEQNHLKALLTTIKDTLKNYIHTFGEGFGISDYYAVAGPYAKKLFMRRVKDSSRIFITGISKFDRIIQRKFDFDKIIQSLKLNPHKRIISILTNAAVEHRLWTNSMRETYINFIISLIKTFQEYQFIIKIHPSENPEPYYRIKKQISHKGNVIVSQNLDLYDILFVSDLVIPGITTTGVEALMFHKPILIVNLFNEPEYYPYVSEGVAKWCFTLDQTIKEIKNILSNKSISSSRIENINNFLFRHVYKIDGKASERIARLIIEIVNAQL